MPPSSGELWNCNFMPAHSTVYCLLPNGIVVPLEARRDKPLYRLKDDLWKLAKNQQEYPFGHLLGEPGQYIFQGVTQDGVREDFYDETRRLCDLRLHEAYLKVREPHGNKDEKMFNQYLSACIGIQIRELDEMRDPEVMEFRLAMVRLCEQAIKDREQSDETRLMFMYPPDLDSTPELAPNLLEKLTKSSKTIRKFLRKIQPIMSISGRPSNQAQRSAEFCPGGPPSTSYPPLTQQFFPPTDHRPPNDTPQPSVEPAIPPESSCDPVPQTLAVPAAPRRSCRQRRPVQRLSPIRGGQHHGTYTT